MRSGDLVVHAFHDDPPGPGVVLEVSIDKNSLRGAFGAPWIYKVMWCNGVVRDHHMGTLRRISVYDRHR